jgi:glycoside/pentoside/hexuronide:cation symporter, GPH family
MNHVTQKLSFREKVGYSLGDSSANFVFQTLMFFQVAFYTGVFGITAAAASWLFLIGRFFDAVTDPLMGVVADRTRSRWGRFRPWLIWSAVPFALIFWLAFTTPDFGPSGKLVYAYLLYLLLMAIYTVNNVPYAALNGVMTGDINERTSLSTYRFVATMTTALIVQGFTWPLVAKFGQGDDAKGWSITMGIFASIAFVFFIIAFFASKERVQPDPAQQSSVKQDVADLKRNRPWIVLFLATLAIFIMLSVRGGSLPLFYQHVVDNNTLYGFLTHFGVVVAPGAELSLWQKFLNVFGYIVTPDRSNVPNVGFGLFNMLANIVTIIGVLCSKPLSERFGKKMVFTTFLALTALATLWLFFIPGNNATLLFLQGIAWSAAYGPTIPLLWSMIADTADYSEWKTGRRATGFVFAGVVFALKFGLGIGGFIGAQVLAAYGYRNLVSGAANPVTLEGDEIGAPLQMVATQSAEALLGIRLTAAVFPTVAIVIAVLILLAYPIGKALNLQIGDELAERRKKFAPGGA